jgi:uncharacterized membrane protein SirB2
MSYLAIQHLHVLTAVITAVLFLLRGIWMLQSSSMLNKRWVNIVPHINDTILLGSAVVMVLWSSQYPFQQDWLTAKVLLLIAYIAAGTVALKRGRTKQVRVTAFILALAFLGYIFKIALTRQVF